MQTVDFECVGVRANGRGISSVYCLKALCAFLVVSIHVPSFYKPALVPLLRTAVPVFFIITGYFLYSSDRFAALGRCKKALRKLFVLFLWSNALYFIFCLSLYFQSGQFPIDNWYAALHFLIVGDMFCDALWYLTACLQTLAVFCVALKFRMERLLYPIIPAGLLFALCFSRYCIFGQPLPLSLVRNAFTTGIPCFLLGWLTHRYADRLPMRRAEPALLLSAVLYYAEYRSIPLPMSDLYAMTVPTAWLLFLCALKHRDAGAGSLTERIGRDHATNIYVLHMLVWYLFSSLCPNALSALVSPQIAAVTAFAAALAASVGLKYLRGCLKGGLSLKNI